ncbi:(2Fe-2S)-binding protein [Methylomonas sp. MED-D]|uniref:Bacterioferritin-associated ferredoxin n=1 Tax=Methylomonas koyamae TaxID=702114 RepID=A0A177NHW4_9GAMM|nr:MULTISPECIES: (2Fe-2S)-binding protein [Methylomonas]NJA07297.1 (2Fe-2S)-binding protein [Methylococcaceae bacterium WWC4]MDT4332652.1 (2Fe-2S)-binding protein [Methylomonas sp. MV1]OAI17455.1 (2Fe-2S)-binding protein [Methylomonas koyamae]OHX34546.1 (2Fe-2S)-binding protein [Methylomonas sp. LWB]WGS85190.1 (2Fe-2S)-binding protein [Methylomonas sp. UP202]
MYICVCKAVTDRQVEQALNEGVCSRKQIMQCTGAGGVCGKCTASIKALIDENLRNQPAQAA